MSQLRERAGFADKALLRLFIVAEVGADQLDGDGPIQKWLSPLVDDAHAAVADDLCHFKIGQPGSQLLG
jgi:hypothetical protein